MCQLRRQPGDQRLPAKVGNQICALLPKAPWLDAIPYFEMEHWTSWMDERIAEEEEAQKKAGIAGWRRHPSAGASVVLNTFCHSLAKQSQKPAGVQIQSLHSQPSGPAALLAMALALLSRPSPLKRMSLEPSSIRGWEART